MVGAATVVGVPAVTKASTTIFCAISLKTELFVVKTDTLILKSPLGFMSFGIKILIAVPDATWSKFKTSIYGSTPGLK